MPFRKLTTKNIDLLSRAITHYAFRSGPVEGMHCAGKLSQEDMKTLNKHMTNRIAGLLLAAKEGKWFEIDQGLNFHSLCTTDWDAAEPDDEFDKLGELLREK
ncbi:hypothetical protein [uncultured Anaeromusa sp.]|uniref:hypothetical protein n=1 Tax=uncultured Anaeromusa sp. TaxID=673273 RepID=UPI0029C89FCB|nr:hypothetical protein [uncultured Anaeromusa sp.]